MSAENGSTHGHDGPPLPPEPQTPMWLPALGAVLFLSAGLWLATRPEEPRVIAAETADAGAAAPGAAGAPGGAAPGTPPPGTPPPGAAPPGRPALNMPDAAMNPDQAAQLQKILQGLGH